MHRMPVLGLPACLPRQGTRRRQVGADAPGDQAQHMTGQMRHLHPARNEEARVVGQALQVAFARGATPAEEGVAFPSYATEIDVLA
jgi:hypothetical protein